MDTNWLDRLAQSKRLLAGLIWVALIVAIFLGWLVYWVHSNAKPNTQINLWIFSYTKDAPLMQAEQPPRTSVLEVKRLRWGDIVPVLDNTINVQVFKHELAGLIQLGGTNVAKLHIAARDSRGNQVVVERRPDRVVIPLPSHQAEYVLLEINHVGQLFSLELVRKDPEESAILTIRSISRTTLQLQHP